MLHINGPKSVETLKILYACYQANISVNLKIIERKEDSDKALSVTLPSGGILTSSNSVVRYVFESTNSAELSKDNVLEWMEWEFICFRRLISIVLLSGKKIEKFPDLVKVLSGLDSHLSQGSPISKNQVISCILLCGLSTVIKDNPNFQSKFPQLFGWFTAFTSQPSFERAWQTLSVGKGASLVAENQMKPVLAPLPSSSASNTACSGNKQENEKISPKELEASKVAWSTGKLPKPKTRNHPVLPVKGERNVLITSALPYVNNVPHLGNIIGCVLSADVFSRYCRLRQWNTLYICGTDEYGTATETKAAQEGVTPQEICTKYNKIHQQVYSWFQVDFDYFGRTTTPKQTAISQEIFWRLYHNKYLIQQTVEQLFCGKCSRFLADRFVEGTCPLCNFDDARGDQCDKCGKLINAVELKDPKCKICSTTPTVKNSEHLFVDLSKLEPKLRDALKASYEGPGWSSNAKTITETWLRDGLKPRCITRDLKWGTPVPLEGFTDKVFYVWFDAPIGYISITANYTDQWEQWWKNPQNVDMYNFMAKDNVPFHSVVFPCCLLGTEDQYTIVNHLNATEYLNYEDMKFSKSRGTGVFGNQAEQTDIPADIWRFYLLYMRPEGQDTQFSWDDFMLKNNSELLNNLGNFINRALKFVKNTYQGKIPACDPTGPDYELMALVNREMKLYIEEMVRIRLRDNLKRILLISRLGNQYLQENQPWKLIKGSDADKARAGTVTCIAANLSCLLSVLIQPYMPVTSDIIQRQLNVPPTVNIIADDACFVQMLPSGHAIAEPSPLFRKFDEAEIASYKERFIGKPEVKPEAGDAKQLEAEVASQGNVVRELKVKKAEKSEIDKEVKKLLDLKQKLSKITGEDLTKSSKKSKKKGKK